MSPEDNPNWKTYNVSRIFCKINLYERAKEKLFLVEQFSDVTAEEGIEDDIKRYERQKQSRHMRTKKKYSSSEECEFDFDRSQKVTKLPPFPKIPEQLYASKEKEMYKSKDIFIVTTETI
ncbi:hypothetical protein EAI_04344 [Harpegnathos saltator]|uniref:Uncharacterized protein n=1 Tax=Harpegnathos saltator TaxID=610380 RepID=E2BD16_HARSA|nr:hypothetical protein EAI_04344 [Harpegnathos saltator]